MSYLIAAYLITFGALGLYGAALMRERARSRVRQESDASATETKS